MAEHSLTLPLTEADVLSLHIGDVVYLTGEIFATAGIPTHDRLLRCLDSREDLPFDFRSSAFFHLGSLNEQQDDGALKIRYMNPTTSTRFNGHMPQLIAGLGLRATGGKGGLDHACTMAMQMAGCVYLSFLGGGAPIITDAIRSITGVGWPDMISHYRIVRAKVERLGPLTVGIDAHGQSLYDRTTATALSRRSEIIAGLRASRDSAQAG